MGSISYAQAIKPDTAQIRKLVENSLLFDWVIRIEYTNNESDCTTWEQWRDTFFALRSADSVLSLIKHCYTNNPGCVIRINAEKVRPQTRMLFTVYKPYRSTDDALLNAVDITPEAQKKQFSSSIRL